MDIRKIIREELYNILNESVHEKVSISDLYVESDNILDAYFKSKNNLGASSRSTGRPLDVTRLLDGSLVLLNGHHRIIDKIKYLDTNNVDDILNLKFDAIITTENYENLDNYPDGEFYTSLFDWIYNMKDILLNEDINIPISVGDEILTGRFKNKKTKIKSIDKNKKGDLTINDKPALKFRIPEKIKEGASNNVTCKSCGWEWKIESIDKNPYLCHKCGYDNKKTNLEQFYERFKQVNSNPNFLSNNFKNPDFELKLGSSVKYLNYGSPNKCETNTFNFIKQMVEMDDHRFYPVSGWAFMESTTYFEHFWVYDTVNDLFIDVSPMGVDKPYAYGGVVNKNINDDILHAEKYSDIPFLRGKTGNSLYCDFSNNESTPKLKKFDDNRSEEEKIFHYIEITPQYKELHDFIQTNNIDTINDLKMVVHKLNNLLYNVRNNRDFDYYNKLIKQIRIMSNKIDLKLVSNT